MCVSIVVFSTADSQHQLREVLKTVLACPRHCLLDIGPLWFIFTTGFLVTHNVCFLLMCFPCLSPDNSRDIQRDVVLQVQGVQQSLPDQQLDIEALDKLVEEVRDHTTMQQARATLVDTNHAMTEASMKVLKDIADDRIDRFGCQEPQLVQNPLSEDNVYVDVVVVVCRHHRRPHWWWASVVIVVLEQSFFFLCCSWCYFVMASRFLTKFVFLCLVNVPATCSSSPMQETFWTTSRNQNPQFPKPK